MYRWKPIPQGDGSTFQWKNCVAAAVAALIDWVTLGRLRPSGADIRALTGDKQGGLDYFQVQKVARDEYGINLKVVLGGTVEMFKNAIAGGSAGAISIEMPYGGHTVPVHRYIWTDRCGCELDLANGNAHAEYVLDDPGTTKAGFVRWSARKLYRLARARTGVTAINFMVAPDTTAVTRVTRDAGYWRSSPSTSSTKVRAFKSGTSVRIVTTDNGGTWKRRNGTLADGWAYGTIPGTTRRAWLRGDKVR